MTGRADRNRTSDSEDATTLVWAALNRLGIKWAMWNEPPEHPNSDFDVVSSMDLVGMLARMHDDLRTVGITPVFAVNYDIGRGDTVWLRASTGAMVQLDVLSDVKGEGRLGIPTDEALVDIRFSASELPLVTPTWQLVYNLAKRVRKRQWSRLEHLTVNGLDSDALMSSMGIVFGSAAPAALELLSQGDSKEWQSHRGRLIRSLNRERRRRSPGGQLGLAAKRIRRGWDRLTLPVGVWIHLEYADSSQADQLKTWLRRLHSRVTVKKWVFPWAARRTTLRPGFIVTWSSGSSRRWRHPDLTLPGLTDFETRVLDFLAARTIQRLE
jgi:hypothetical protein